MKKIFIIFIALIFYSTSAVAVEKMKFKYNFHENLPKKWVTEFKNIMNIVQEEFPINENTNTWVKREINRDKPFNIYLWLDTNKDPFPEFKKNGKKFIMNESAIMGDGGGNTWMQMKVHKQDLRENVSMSYYVVVHEYFHIYQKALSKLLNGSLSNYNPKWLVEGGATVLGNIYTRQYYGKDTLKSDIRDRKRWKFKKVTKEPHLYEKHKTSPHKGYDSNYAGSSFMLLALVNELKKNNISEEEAFELVFREYWIQRSKQPFDNTYWRVAFKNTFGMSVEDFYKKLSKYKRKDLKKILPSKTLKIQNIF
ncbi:hypothetical protein N9387_00310 [Candidatus Pelagibacter sp.]|nr:hypothetical protein [Candidatus Pelagibacter sp.]